MPAADMNEDVLQALEEYALTPETIQQVILLSERDDFREREKALLREQKDLAKRIGRLVEVIESGGDAAALVAKLRELEARQQAIQTEIAGLRPIPRLAPEVVDSRLAEWRRLLRQSTTQSRAVLQRVLRGRIIFTPRADGRGYDFTCATRFDKLFSGVTSPIPAWMERCDGLPTPGGHSGRHLRRRLWKAVGKSLPLTI